MAATDSWRVIASLSVHERPDRLSPPKRDLVFGDILAVVGEVQEIGGEGWLEIGGVWGSGPCAGWVLQRTEQNCVRCVDMARWLKAGPVPESAHPGVDFPEKLHTEGFPGERNVCVVSASGDNMWRHLNVEMLFKSISTATVFEESWGGSAAFTDWVAYYAFNVAEYANLGSGRPREMVVVTKNVLHHRSYPRRGPSVEEVAQDIGQAQFKECEWIRNIFRKKGLPWSAVRFMTAFQFLQEHANWTEADCQAYALRRLEAALGEKERGSEYARAQLVACLAEAYGVGEAREILGALPPEAVPLWRLWYEEDVSEALADSGQLELLRGRERAQAVVAGLLESPERRERAIRWAEEVWPRDEPSVRALQNLAAHKNWRTRKGGLEELGGMVTAGDGTALRFFIVPLKDKDTYIRKEAARALGHVLGRGPEASRRLLQEVLADHDRPLRAAALLALLGAPEGSLGSQPAFQAVCRSLDVAEALERFAAGRGGCLEAVYGLFGSPEPEVRRSAVRVVAEVVEQDASLRARAWDLLYKLREKEEEEEVCLQVEEALAGL